MLLKWVHENWLWTCFNFWWFKLKTSLQTTLARNWSRNGDQRSSFQEKHQVLSWNVDQWCGTIKVSLPKMLWHQTISHDLFSLFLKTIDFNAAQQHLIKQQYTAFVSNFSCYHTLTSDSFRQSIVIYLITNPLMAINSGVVKKKQ